MKPALYLLGALLLCEALCAQEPPAPTAPTAPAQNPTAPAVPGRNTTAPLGPVPINEEPHHRLLLQNDFVHVYNVVVPPLDATLLHQHDLPYLYITLGSTDIVNAIVGQPESHLTLQNGETHYAPGKFAHVVRTDSGMAFHIITIELLRPQGAQRNLCKEVLPGAAVECPQEAASGKKTASEAADDFLPYFETDEVRVELRKVAEGRDYVEEAPKVHTLLVALTDANLNANLGGEHVSFLHGGEVLWLPAGVPRRIVDFLGTHSSFLLISFKDGAANPVKQ